MVNDQNMPSNKKSHLYANVDGSHMQEKKNGDSSILVGEGLKRCKIAKKIRLLSNKIRRKTQRHTLLWRKLESGAIYFLLYFNAWYTWNNCKVDSR